MPSPHLSMGSRVAVRWLPVLLAMSPAVLSAQSPDRRGDVNRSGSITAFDALLTLSAVVGKSLPPNAAILPHGDATCDGSVTAADALATLRLAVGLATPETCVGTVIATDVRVAPSPVGLAVGDTVRASVSLFDSEGSPLEPRPVAWSSANPQVLQVSSAGLVTAAGNGLADVVATVEGIPGHGEVNVAAIAEGTVEIAADVAELVSDSSQLAAGEYVFVFSGPIPSVAPGNVVLGDEGDGFLREVSSVQLFGDTLVLQTTPATLGQAVEEGAFHVRLQGVAPGGGPPATPGAPGLIVGPRRVVEIARGVDFIDGGVRLTDVSLFSGESCKGSACGTLSVTVPTGEVRFAGDFDARADMGGLLSGSAKLEASVEARVDFFADLRVRAEGGFDETGSVTLVRTVVPFKVPIGPLLVPGVLETTLVATAHVDGDAAVSATIGAGGGGSVQAGGRYENEAFDPTFEVDGSFHERPLRWEASGNVHASLDIRRRDNLLVLGVIGPGISTGYTPTLNGSFAFPECRADARVFVEAGADLEFNLGFLVRDEVLKSTGLLRDTADVLERDWIVRRSLAAVSGDAQVGERGLTLQDSLMVHLTDSLGAPVGGAAVDFVALAGGGAATRPSPVTDGGGRAQVGWTLGELDEVQRIRASAACAPEHVDFVANEPLPFDLAFLRWTPEGRAISLAGPDIPGFIDLVGPANQRLEGPRLSPDRQTVLYVYSADGSELGKDIWSVNRDGVAVPVLATDSIADSPAWSPAGGAFVFRRCGVGGCRMWLRGADLSQTFLDGDTCNPSQMDWGVSGIAYISSWFDTGSGISCVEVPGRVMLRGTPPSESVTPVLPPDNLHEGLPRVSPDGTRIVYLLRRDGLPNAHWIVNTDGSGAHMVGEGGLADWTADGVRLIYESFGELWELKLLTGERTRLWKLSNSWFGDIDTGS